MIGFSWRSWRHALVLALFTSSVALPARADAPSRTPSGAPSDVPTPTVTPLSGGLHGGPQDSSVVDVTRFGYVEEEFLVSGTARKSTLTGLRPDTGPPTTSDVEPYTTRIMIRRPAAANRFSGTVFLEWLNVSAQTDLDAVWEMSYDTIMRRSYVWVGVSAQKQGVDGSPLALKEWDPVRYGMLQHPGDAFAPDIYSQVGQALRVDAGGALGSLKLQYLIGTGESQSGGFLRDYINGYYDVAWRVFDGFLPQMVVSTIPALVGVPSTPSMKTDTVPTLVVDGESESGTISAPSGGSYRVWEVTGSSHGDPRQTSYLAAELARVTAGPSTAQYDPENPPATGYGEDSRRTRCPVQPSVFPTRYAHHASLVAIDSWVRGGKAPKGYSFARDTAGAIFRDPTDGNVVGGLRLPPISVPIAVYTGNHCFLLGDHVLYAAVRLRALYPTHDDYVAKTAAAVKSAVDAKIMLAEDGPELLAHARRSSIPVPPAALLPRP
jgi:hypothetical protein